MRLNSSPYDCCICEKGRKFSIDRVDAIRVKKKFESLYVGVFVKKGGNFWKFSIDVIYLYKK